MAYSLQYLTFFNTSWYTWHPLVIGMAPNRVTAIHDEARVADNIHYVIVGI